MRAQSSEKFHLVLPPNVSLGGLNVNVSDREDKLYPNHSFWVLITVSCKLGIRFLNV
jgi:hypothetical protein